MSYTNKKITWEKCNEESASEEVNAYGDSIMNEYNDICRSTPVAILARKQPHEDVIKTSDGKDILTKSYFYIDPKIEPRALEIKYMDKLDGETVMQKYVMCDLHNSPKMIRFITI